MITYCVMGHMYTWTQRCMFRHQSDFVILRFYIYSCCPQGLKMVDQVNYIGGERKTESVPYRQTDLDKQIDLDRDQRTVMSSQLQSSLSRIKYSFENTGSSYKQDTSHTIAFAYCSQHLRTAGNDNWLPKHSPEHHVAIFRAILVGHVDDVHCSLMTVLWQL